MSVGRLGQHYCWQAGLAGMLGSFAGLAAKVMQHQYIGGAVRREVKSDEQIRVRPSTLLCVVSARTGRRRELRPDFPPRLLHPLPRPQLRHGGRLLPRPHRSSHRCRGEVSHSYLGWSLGKKACLIPSRRVLFTQLTPSSSLVSTAANLLSTGLLAAVVCGERVTLGWAAGAGLVCAGLALLTRGEESNKED